jgi:hypothetical protein
LIGRLVLSISILAGPAACPVPAEVASTPVGATYDCGIIALYYLCQLEGLSVDLKQIQGQLPPANPLGYSMRELRDAG